MPEGHVNLPGGLKLRKNVAIGLGVAAVGIAGYMWYRNKQNTAASSTATTPQTTADNTDPATGYPYGSPEDTAALASQGGYYGQAYGGGYGGYSPQTQGGQSPPQGFQDNAQWTQAAEQLMGSTGADAIAAALGKYLVGAPVTSDQVTIIQQAIAAEGYPPVPGPNGFPPSYKTQESGPPPGVVAHNPVKGLAAEPRFTQIDVHWQPLANAKDYLVKAYQGSRMVQQTTVTGTFATLHDLKRGTTYRITVWGQVGDGHNASVRATTKK